MKSVRYWDKKSDLVVSLRGGDRYSVPLYAIHDVAEFIRGLYFDDTYACEKPLTFDRIAEILEKEGG